MNIKIDESDAVNIQATKAELKKAYTSYDKFIMYNLIFDLLKTIDTMYKHIMSDEPEWGGDGE